MVNPKKRPASEQAQPAKSKAVRPSAKRRVERRIAGYQEYLKGNTKDFVRHDPATETLPDLLAYDDEFMKAERACLEIPQDFILAVKPDKDPQLAASLRPKLNEVMDEYQSEPERVAVVGKTGQGKSKLIDAILGIDGIARSGASGVATTRIPIVYSPRRAHIQTPYEVRLELSGKIDCRDSVQQHLANLVANLKRCVEGPIELDDQGQDSLRALQNLFSDIPEFASNESTWTFLGYDVNSHKFSSVAKQKDAFGQCVKWAEDRRQKIANMSAQGIYATNVTELRRELAQFSDDQAKMDDTKLGFNPSALVERIEVFGDFRIRYSIGDCPGLQDINKASLCPSQVDIAQANLAEEITRAGDSAFLDHLINDRTTRRPDQRIIIALTMGESNLNPSDRKDASFDQHEKADLDWLAERKAETRRKKDSYAPTDYAQRDHCAREIAFMTLEENEICARERGRRISDRLRERFAKQNGNLTVMTTSAKDYMEHVEGYHQYTDEHLPLSVESTQIPSLCRELAAIANERLQKDLLRFYRRTLPELFSYIELACSTTSGPVQTGPRFNFEEFASKLLKPLEVFLDVFENELILPRIESMRNGVGDWKNEGHHNINNVWRRLHGNAVRCYLNKLGNHRTKGQPNCSWNITLLRAVQKTLDPLFKELIAEAPSRLGSLAYQLEGVVDDFLEALHVAAEQLDSKNFVANLDDKKPQLYNMYDVVGKDLMIFLRLFRGRLTEDGNGDFFPQKMKPVYTATLKAKPTGKLTMKEVQMQTLEARICGDNSPYDQMVDKFEAAWKAKKIALLEIGRQAIAFHIAEIKASYKQLCTPELQDNSMTLLRAELERKVGVAREQCKGPILASLLECGLDPNLKKEKKEKKVKREKKVAKVEK
ncbi:uncharacterized protein J4E87_007924 [Alternaria ethzedia]|uniref:uncharacterized protein n=1 Tax=Alternaria ethzedia TaxID=181014 RepID=UPI0020C52314|nr:uncharacterized protein J4E87_007924 [Alternaria ethzedia]KAI4618256.1 hypothetical protein J4E87_007924 [Alternaria ethzedia]